MDQTDQTSNPGFVSRVKSWAMYPVTTKMDFLDVVLTAILVATVGFAWIAVLRHITED